MSKHHRSEYLDVLMFVLVLIAIVLMITGCSTPNKAYVQANGLRCICDDPKLTTNPNGEYKCECKEKQVGNLRENHPELFVKEKEEQKDEGCKTKHTVKYYSKASVWITTCQGRLLKDGEKTKILTRKE